MECQYFSDEELSYLMAKEILQQYFTSAPSDEQVRRMVMLLSVFEGD